MSIGLSDGNNTSGNGNTDKFSELFKDEYAVILLQGRNSFGDMIFSYVEVTLPNIKRLYAALNSGEDFAPSDFGSIIASGKGNPPDSLREEMARTHNMLQPITPSVFNANNNAPTVPAGKKAWDEF
jgi:hypothetical protein